jgi:hypothetical protein
VPRRLGQRARHVVAHGRFETRIELWLTHALGQTENCRDEIDAEVVAGYV